MSEEQEEIVEHEESDSEAEEQERQEEQQKPRPESASDPESEREASKWGWTPKSEWRGNPDDWRPAEEFLDDPRTQRRILEASNKRFEEQEARHKEEMAALKRATDLANKRIAEVEKGGHERTVADIQRQIEEAAEEGDVAKVRQLTGELTKVTPPAPQKEEGESADEPPEVRSFKARNPWFTNDPALNMEAQAIHVRLSSKHPHMPLEENLKHVEEEIKRRYPEDFGITNGSGEPRKERVQRVAGSEARGGGGGSNARSFSAIPAADRAVAKKHYIGEGKVFKTEKEYAKAYFEENEVEQ